MQAMQSQRIGLLRKNNSVAKAFALPTYSSHSQATSNPWDYYCCSFRYVNRLLRRPCYAKQRLAKKQISLLCKGNLYFLLFWFGFYLVVKKKKGFLSPANLLGPFAKRLQKPIGKHRDKKRDKKQVVVLQSNP